MGIQIVNEIVGQYSISKGFTKDDLKKLVEDKNVKHLQFSDKLNAIEVDYLEEIVFSKRDDISLRVFGFYLENCDLSFLERIPSLTNLSIDCLREATNVEVVTKLKNIKSLGIGIYNLESFDFLYEINPKLKELYLHQTKSKKTNLNSIDRFLDLEVLYLESQSKGIEKINSLKKLKEITLRSISTKNVDYLNNLNELWSVDIKIGGIKNFDTLQTLPNLKYLELWQVRELSDLSFISNLKSLQNLFIQSLRNVTIFPDLQNLLHLRRIYLENLKGLKDISSVKNVPFLEEFVFTNAENLEPNDIIPILENKSIQNISCWFGNKNKNEIMQKLLVEYKKEMYKFTKFQYK